MTIGERVRERRTALGITQEHLAHEVGISWTAIQRLEVGRSTDPHYSTLSGIADALDTTIAELVGEEPAVPLGEPPNTGDYDEVLIPWGPLTPEVYRGVQEILVLYEDQREMLSVTIENGYVAVGLKLRRQQ